MKCIYRVYTSRTCLEHQIKNYQRFKNIHNGILQKDHWVRDGSSVLLIKNGKPYFEYSFPFHPFLKVVIT